MPVKVVGVLLFAGLVGVLAAQSVAPVAPALPAAQTPDQASSSQAFEATWSASGERQTLTLEAGHPAVTVQLSGAVTITSGAALGRGFRGEFIGFDDGAGVVTGRAVWTDEKGDRIFSVLTGEALTSDGRPLLATITGGTGRYAGVTGEYLFRWQSLIATDGNHVSGRAVDLRGRVRGQGRR
jgi:hypothetical protein